MFIFVQFCPHLFLPYLKIWNGQNKTLDKLDKSIKVEKIQTKSAEISCKAVIALKYQDLAMHIQGRKHDFCYVNQDINMCVTY